ncbi:MAG: hypothetical protein L6Q95_15475 [Planctomycetes bacterium]|nr:hypothetical protein [Planctomycetota bacterium]
MRRPALLALGLLCGALAVSGQEDAGDPLLREIDRMKRLLEERIAKAAAQAEERVVLRTYDVSDLCTRLSDHGVALENLTPSKYEAPREADESEPWAAYEIDSLIELMKSAVEPASWEMEGADIQPKNGRLFIRAIPRVHGRIERMLAWCRTSMDRRVSVDVAVVPVGDGDAALLANALELTADEARRLLAQPLAAVTLSGFDGQLLGGRAGREISYLRDYEVEIADGAAIADPAGGKVFSGCTAEVRACLDGGEGAILHCQLEMSRVAEPLSVHPTAHGPIELPTKRLTRVQASFWAPLGRTVVAGGCTAGEEPCVILVTARRR